MQTMLTALMNNAIGAEARHATLVAHYAAKNWDTLISHSAEAPRPIWVGFPAFPGGDTAWPTRFAVTQDLGDKTWVTFTESHAGADDDRDVNWDTSYSDERNAFRFDDNGGVSISPDWGHVATGQFSLLTWCRGCWTHGDDDAALLFETPISNVLEIKQVIEKSEHCRSSDHTGRKLPRKRLWPQLPDLA